MYIVTNLDGSIMGNFSSPALRVLLFCSLIVSTSLAYGAQPLVLLTWPDYIDPAVVAEFEDQEGVDVRLAHFDSDDARTRLLAETSGLGFDLMVTSGSSLRGYAQRGWLAPLNATELPNLRHVSSRWINAFPSAKRYAVPYFWGTLGIAYRSDLYPQGFSSWKDLYEPDDALRGRIVMLSSARDLFGMAMKSLGHSSNDADESKLRTAAQLLRQQQPFVRRYGYISLSQASALVSGDVWASMIFSGDALTLRDHHSDIRFVAPDEGGNLWVDYLTVLESSPRKALAHRFINFLNTPENAARVAAYVHYATPNTAAESCLDDAFLLDGIIYPPSETIARSEMYQRLPPSAIRLTNAVTAELVNQSLMGDEL